MEIKMKPFSEIQVGDIATEYGDHKMKVLFKGTLKKCFEKYGHRCSMGLSDYLEDPDISENDLALVLQDTPNWDGDCSIYLHGTEGAYVEQP